MTSINKLYQEIRLRDAGDLSARLLRVVETAAGSYKRRLPAHEVTAAEFLQKLKPGSPASMHDFIVEHDALPNAWREIPKELIGDDIIRRADRALDQRMDYPGGEYYFHDKIDWHHALNKNASWPRAHWSEIPFRRIGHLGDIKSCWEMNRHQFFPALALAWRKTGDTKYIAALQRFIHGWCDQNTPETGVNYISGLELGLRCISWIFTDKILRGEGAYDEIARERLHRNIWSQAKHIAEYLPYTEKTGRNNHLIGEAAALAFIALNYPHFDESEKWLRLGLTALWSTFDEQVFPDGMHFEGSFGYHLLVTEFILLLFCELRRHNRPIPPKARILLEQMAEVLAQAQQPDGELPNVNDNDSGLALPFACETDARVQGVLAVAAAAYHRPDFKAGALHKFNLTAFMLIGETGDTDFRVIADLPDYHAPLTLFKNSGFAVLRAQGDYALLKNNPDPFPKSGHNHADLLSLLLFLDGKPVLVDAGTYRYSADGGFRNALRGTAAHNTLTVDGKNQAEPSRNFGWTSLTRPGLIHAQDAAGITVLDAAHASFGAVRHRRAVLWIHEKHAFAVIDRLEGEHAHSFEQYWHFPHDARLEDAGHHHYRLIIGEHLRGHVRFFRENHYDTHEIVVGSARTKWSHISTRYGEIEPGTTLKHAWSSDLTPEHASHRITLFCKEGLPLEVEDIGQGLFRVAGYSIDMNREPLAVFKA